MTSIKDKLIQTILALESDQILQQMRNDQTLYNYKIQHIRQLIHDQLRLQDQMTTISEENQELKEKIKRSQQLNQSLREEYASELEHIQIKCKQFINQKEIEKQGYELKHKTSMDELKDQIKRLKKQIDLNKEQNLKFKIDNQNLREDRRKLEIHKADSQDQIRKIKREYQQKNRETQKNFKEFYQQKSGRQISQYEQIIAKMQKDMHLIKECWERKCFDIENQAKEQCHLIAIQLQQKFRRQLKQHAQTLKLGNSVIISDSEQVIARRVEVIEHGFRDKIHQSEKKNQQLQQMLQIIKQQMYSIKEKHQELKNDKKSQELYVQRLIQQKQDKQSISLREIQKLKKEIKNKDNDITNWKNNYEEMQRQTKQKRDELLSLNKKCSSLGSECLQYQQEINTLSNKLTQLNSIHQEHLNHIINQKQQIIQKQHIINASNNQLQTLKEKNQNFEKTLAQQKNKQVILNQHIRKLHQKQKRLLNKIDKTHLTLRKLKKDQQILKQQVKCVFQMLRNRFSIQMTNFGDQMHQIKEMLDRKYRQRMSQMLDQMEGKQAELIDSLKEQKQAMKSQVKEYEKLLQKGEEQIMKLSTTLKEEVKNKKDLLEQLEKQKMISMRFEEKIQINEQTFMNNLSRVQKDVARSLSGFNSRWGEEIGRVQEELQNKQIKIKIFAENIEHITADLEDSKKQQSWMEEELRKYKKKYQNTKSQRDQKIETLLKKLDQEAKHRLNLERQMKEMRMAIMKGTYQTNNTNFSFNDKEKEYTNNKPTFMLNSKRQKNRDEQLELTELRDMVAKASQMFGEPAEKDNTRNNNKRALF